MLGAGACSCRTVEAPAGDTDVLLTTLLLLCRVLSAALYLWTEPVPCIALWEAGGATGCLADGGLEAAGACACAPGLTWLLNALFLSTEAELPPACLNCWLETEEYRAEACPIFSEKFAEGAAGVPAGPFWVCMFVRSSFGDEASFPAVPGWVVMCGAVPVTRGWLIPAVVTLGRVPGAFVSALTLLGPCFVPGGTELRRVSEVWEVLLWPPVELDVKAEWDSAVP